MRRTSALVFVLFFAAIAGRADFNADAIAAPDFPAGLRRVAVIAVNCHESIDCGEVEDAVAADLVERKPGFAVVAPNAVRTELFARGVTELTDELRPAILEKLQADGVLEINVPYASRGDGFGGRRRSEVRVELRLAGTDGRLHLSGRGSGRPKNVVSGTERVAGTIIGQILDKVLPRR